MVQTRCPSPTPSVPFLLLPIYLLLLSTFNMTICQWFIFFSYWRLINSATSLTAFVKKPPWSHIYFARCALPGHSRINIVTKAPSAFDQMGICCARSHFKTWESLCKTIQLLPPANKVWGKVIFSEACVKNSIHGGEGSIWAGTPHTRYIPQAGTLPGPGTPPWSGTPPRTRYTPWAGRPPRPGTPLGQVHPLPQMRHTPRTRYTPQSLHETFTTGLIFVRQSKQGVTTLCFEHNYTSLMWRFHIKLLKIDQDI